MSRIKKGYLLMNEKKFPVYEGLNLIGRSKQSTVMILENTVSHQQAAIIIINDKHYICDMNSCNGTQLEHGKLVPLQLYELEDKKTLYFGNIKVVYELLLHESNSQEQSQFSQINESLFDIPTQVIPVNEVVSINKNNESLSTAIIPEKNNINKPTIYDLPTQIIDDNLDDIPHLNVSEIKVPETSTAENCTANIQKHVSIHDMATQIHDFEPEKSKKNNNSPPSDDLLQQINEELKDIPDKSWDEDFFAQEKTVDEILFPNNQQNKSNIQQTTLVHGDNQTKQPDTSKTSSDEETNQQTAPNELSTNDEIVINETIQNDDEDANSRCSEDFFNVIPVTELYDDSALKHLDPSESTNPSSSLSITQSSQENLQTSFLKRKIKNVITSDDENNETRFETPISSLENQPCSLRTDSLKRKVRNVICSDSESYDEQKGNSNKLEESSDETDIDDTQKQFLKKDCESSDETDVDLKIENKINKRKKKLVKKQSHKKDDQKPDSSSETDIEDAENSINNQLNESDFIPASQNCFVNALSSFQKKATSSQASVGSKDSNSQTSIDFSLDLMLTESLAIDLNETKSTSGKLPTIQENIEDVSEVAGNLHVVPTRPILLNQVESTSSIVTQPGDVQDDSFLILSEDLDVQKEIEDEKSSGNENETASFSQENAKKFDDVDDAIFLEPTQCLTENILKNDELKDIYSKPTQKILPNKFKESKNHDDEIFLEPTQPIILENANNFKNKDAEVFNVPNEVLTFENSKTSKRNDEILVSTPMASKLESRELSKNKQFVTMANSNESDDKNDKDIYSEPTQEIVSDDIFLQPTQPVIVNSNKSENKGNKDIYSKPTQDIVFDQSNKSKDDDDIFLEPTQPVKVVNQDNVVEDIYSKPTQDIVFDQSNKSKDDDDIFLEPTQPVKVVNQDNVVKDIYSKPTQDIVFDQFNKSKDDDDIFLEPTQPVKVVNQDNVVKDIYSEPTQETSCNRSNGSKDSDDILFDPTQPIKVVNQNKVVKDVYSEPTQESLSDQPSKSKEPDVIFLEPIQLITSEIIKVKTDSKIQENSKKSGNKDDDDIFLEPTQPVIINEKNSIECVPNDYKKQQNKFVATKKTNKNNDDEDDIFLQPTQLVSINVENAKQPKIDELKRNVSNIEDDDDDIFLGATQLVTPELINVNNDDDKIFLNPTVSKIQESKKSGNKDVDEDIFLQPTQPVIINDKNPCEYIASESKKQQNKCIATKKMTKNNDDEDDIFLQSTQLVSTNVNYSKQSNTDESTKISVPNTEDDDIFLGTTQPVVITKNILPRTSKLEICKFPAIQIRHDLYEASSSKSIDTIEETMEKMFQSQPNKDISTSVISHRSSVESQMEIIFASQLPNTKNDCRPQNPLANILENLQSQNEMVVSSKHIDEIKQEKKERDSKSKSPEISDVKLKIESGKKSEKIKDNNEDIKVKEKRKSSRRKSKNEEELLEILQASKIEKEKARRNAHKIQNETRTSKEKNISLTHSKIKSLEDQPDLSSTHEKIKSPIDPVLKKSEYVHKIKVATQNNPEKDNLKPQKKTKTNLESSTSHEKGTSPIDPSLKKSEKVKDDKELKNEKVIKTEQENLPKRKTRLRNKSVGDKVEEDLLKTEHKTTKKTSRFEHDNLKENKHHKTENTSTTIEHRSRSNTDKHHENDQEKLKRSHRTKKSPNPSISQSIDKTIGDSISQQSSNNQSNSINLSEEEPNVAFGDNSDSLNEVRRSKRKANTGNTNKTKLKKHKNEGVLSLIDELPEYSESTDNSKKVEVIDLSESPRDLKETKSMKTPKRNVVGKTEDENKILKRTRQKQRRRSSASEDDFIVKATVKRSKLDMSKRDLSQSSNTSDITNPSGSVLQTPERSRRKLKPKVVFTMMDNPELESLIRRLGGSVVDSVDSSTVLMSLNVKRSLKLLTAIGQGKPICSPDWLEECKKANQFLDPWNFILRDPEAETKWNFSLEESLNRSRIKKIFENYFFLLLTNTAIDVLKASIEACGGKSAQRCPPKSQNIQNFVIVSQEENRSKYSKYLKQDLKPTIIHYEAVLDAILRQEINFDKHILM